eukprot:2082250-Rhodomonas_salina.1
MALSAYAHLVLTRCLVLVAYAICLGHYELCGTDLAYGATARVLQPPPADPKTPSSAHRKPL